MKIKKATIADAEILAELCSEIQDLHIKFQPHIFRKPSHQELVGVFKERVTDSDYKAFLAFDDGKPVGYIVLHILKKPENVFLYEQNVLEIDHIYVVESRWRQGICKKLFAKAHEVARSINIKDVQLGVWVQNDRAIAAFKSLGFKPQYQKMALEE